MFFIYSKINFSLLLFLLDTSETTIYFFTLNPSVNLIVYDAEQIKHEFTTRLGTKMTKST